MQWTKPKSVRQVGDIPGKGRIYMEDYVIRFARKIAHQGHGMEKAAVLLGNRFLSDGDKIYQISAMVEIPNFAGRSGPELTGNIWDKIYQEMKENFTDLEIIGWFYSCRGFSVHQAGRLLEIHKANFQHRDKILFIYEECEKEENFFLYRNGQFEKQKGYYIYYEKNPEMLRYMERENNRHIHLVEQEDDRVVRNIRGIMEEKEKKREYKKKKEHHIGYGIAAMAALIVVLVGVVTIQNQSALKQVKEKLEVLQTINQSVNSGKSDETKVEVKEAGVTPLQATPSPTPAASAPGSSQSMQPSGTVPPSLSGTTSPES